MALLQTVEQLHARHTSARQQAAEAAYALAGRYAAQQSWRVVGELLTEAIQLQPENVKYLQVGTQFAFDRKNHEVARELLLRAIRVVEQQGDSTPARAIWSAADAEDIE